MDVSPACIAYSGKSETQTFLQDRYRVISGAVFLVQVEFEVHLFTLEILS